jgi:hypothetical protein
MFTARSSRFVDVASPRSRRMPIRPRTGKRRPRLEILEPRCLLTVNLGPEFTGMNFAQTGVGTPPDTIAAAGPSEVVELVNTNIAIYTKTGTQVFTQDLGTFFSGQRTGNALSDCFVIYDEQAGRFLVGIMDLSTTIFGTVNSDRLLVAASSNSNPTSSADFTQKYSINATVNRLSGSGQTFADFPRIGWDADEYVIATNQFTTGSTEQYDHVLITSINRSALLAGTLSDTQVSRDGTNFTMAPATMHGSQAGGLMYFVEEAPVANTIRVVAATGLLTSTPTFTQTDIGLPAAADYTAPPAATQKGSSALITTNDSRILNAEWQNNELVAAQNVGVAADSQAHARWYQFDTTATPTLVQQGTIGVGSGSNSYFPAIAIDPQGDLGMSFIESSPSEYMSMYVTGRAAADPSGTMQTPVVAQAGVAPYAASFDTSPYRAGDFSGITVDISPTTPFQPINAFWAANEYATATGPAANWGTALASFSVTPTGPDTQPPSATVTSPNGGENWAAGTVHAITWTATDNVGVTSIDLSYSTSGPGGPFTTIATGLSNTGTYNWTVPNTPTSNAYVEVVAHDAAGNPGSDLSNAAFTISPPVTTLSVTGISPNNMSAGQTISVTISGTGFVTGATVTFVNGSGSPPTASNVVVVNSTTITARINAPRTARTSTWGVQVTNPAGTSATLANGFSVKGRRTGVPVGGSGLGDGGGQMLLGVADHAGPLPAPAAGAGASASGLPGGSGEAISTGEAPLTPSLIPTQGRPRASRWLSWADPLS